MVFWVKQNISWLFPRSAICCQRLGKNLFSPKIPCRAVSLKKLHHIATLLFSEVENDPPNCVDLSISTSDEETKSFLVKFATE